MALNPIPPISVRDLHFTYGGTPVLNSISCDIQCGERVAVLGPNGAGKSTFFHILSGLLPAYRGEVRLGDREVKTLSRCEIARHLALVPQRHDPVFPYPVREFILMGRHPHLGTFSQPGVDDMMLVETAAEEIGITHLLDRPYSNLSGGELQLVLLARALTQDSPVLMLDEPNSHLDFRNRFRVLDLVCCLSVQKKLTVLMTLHDPNDVLQFANRVLVIGEGTILADGAPAETLNSDLLRRLYGVPVTTLHTEEGSVLFKPSRSDSHHETCALVSNH
ncbi:MAG TPA: ABC transporter ATP-binding protein [Candidatus Ozemobacteraceae bacterium]|nr:ABC transporter ATP-binding protein [Candidatus Ozemobacteraceae bacterium]